MKWLVPTLLVLVVAGVFTRVTEYKKFASPPQIGSAQPDTDGISFVTWLPYWDEENAKRSFYENLKSFTHIATFNHWISESGEIRRYKDSYDERGIIELAHSESIAVLANLANLPDFSEGGDWDAKRVGEIIFDENRRREHIGEIVDLLNEQEYNGLVLDYEALGGEMRDSFTEFVHELAEALHTEGMTLGVAVHAKTSEFDPNEDNGSHAQDIVELSAAADQLYLMLFDQHNQPGTPGPVGSIEWMREVLDYMVVELPVDRSRFFVSLPLFGYKWNSCSGAIRGIEYNETQSVVDERKLLPKWSMSDGEWSLSYVDESGCQHEIWYNDKQSIGEKIEILKEYGISNYSFWRIGQEDDRIWQSLSPLGGAPQAIRPGEQPGK